VDKWHSFLGEIPGGLIERPDLVIIVVNRFFMKVFKTNNIDEVNYCRCRMQFNFELPSVTTAQRSRKFADKYRLCDNVLCKSLIFR